MSAELALIGGAGLLRRDDSVIINGDALAVSLYDDNPATSDEVTYALNKLKMAFPKTDNNFLNIVREAIGRHAFTSARLMDAVYHVIDTKPYGTFAVADIVQYDRCFKLYSSYDRNHAVWNGVDIDEFISFGKVCGKFYYVKASDMACLSESQRNTVRRLIRKNKSKRQI